MAVDMTGESTGTPPQAPRRGRVVGALVVVALLGAGAFLMMRESGDDKPASDEAGDGLHATGGSLEGAASAGALRYVDVSVAQLSASVPPLPAPGRVLVADARATPIVATLEGRIEQVAVQQGDTVKPGTPLLAIRSSALPELGREIESARAALAVKRASVTRLQELVTLRAVPEKDLLLAQAELHETEIALRTAESKRGSLRLGASKEGSLYWINAPRGGTVVDRHALVGMVVGPDRTEPLLSIAELDEVVVVADLLEPDVAGVKAGEKALVAPAASTGGTPIAGTVEYVGAVVDPVRRTVAVRLRVPNPERRLRPNAFAEVTFTDPDTVQKVVVPAEAVDTDGQTAVVFVRQEVKAGHYRFSKRVVVPGRSRDGRTEILTGLAPGETFVSRGAILLLNALDLES